VFPERNPSPACDRAVRVPSFRQTSFTSPSIQSPPLSPPLCFATSSPRGQCLYPSLVVSGVRHWSHLPEGRHPRTRNPNPLPSSLRVCTLARPPFEHFILYPVIQQGRTQFFHALPWRPDEIEKLSYARNLCRGEQWPTQVAVRMMRCERSPHS
jgi:hypothetical protein